MLLQQKQKYRTKNRRVSEFIALREQVCYFRSPIHYYPNILLPWFWWIFSESNRAASGRCVRGWDPNCACHERRAESRFRVSVGLLATKTRITGYRQNYWREKNRLGLSSLRRKKPNWSERKSQKEVYYGKAESAIETFQEFSFGVDLSLTQRVSHTVFLLHSHRFLQKMAKSE